MNKFLEREDVIILLVGFVVFLAGACIGIGTLVVTNHVR